jgi:hypothetical protein
MLIGMAGVLVILQLSYAGEGLATKSKSARK